MKKILTGLIATLLVAGAFPTKIKVEPILKKEVEVQPICLLNQKELSVEEIFSRIQKAPAGYTTAKKKPNNSCEDGFSSVNETITCHEFNLEELSEGWLNLTITKKSIALSSNLLTQIDNLKNLTVVEGVIELQGNELMNVDGLKNLTSVGGLILSGNTGLDDLTGLNNLQEVKYKVVLDDEAFEKKMASNSFLCQNFIDKVDGAEHLTKSNYCEEDNPVLLSKI
jgi:hypothetical protein